MMHIPECQDCAACCFAKHDCYVPVSGDDYDRIGDEAERLVSRNGSFQGNKAFMKMTEGHCMALVKKDGRFACSIYEKRPQVCRDVERKSLECKAAIWGL